MPLRTLIHSAVLAIMVVASPAHAAHANHAGRAPGLAEGSPWSAAALAPGGAELVVVLDDLASECDRAEGSALVGALESTGLVRETARAWRDLASRLDLTPTDAVRALMGRRVLLAMSGLARADAEPAWVVASVIDRETATRLRRALAPVPRGVIAGITELAIEDGAYRASILPEPGADAWVLVLAPRDAHAMRAGLVRALRSGASDAPFAPLAEPGSAAAGLNEGTVALAYRPRAAQGLETLAATIRRVPGGWRAAAAMDTARPFDHRVAGLPAIAAEDLLAECSLAFLGRVGTDPATPGALDPSRWAGVLVGAVLEGVFTGLPEACGPETGLLAVRRGARTPDGGRPDPASLRGELLVGARLDDACDAGDAARAAASRVWAGLSGTAAGGVGLETNEGRALIRLPTPSAGAAVFGPEAVVSWAGLGGPGARWSVLGVKSAGGVGGEPWPTARRLFDPEAPGERVVLAGVLHPGELAGVLGPGAGVVGGLGAWVDRVSWWAWGAQEGPRLVGRAELIMRTKGRSTDPPLP